MVDIGPVYSMNTTNMKDHLEQQEYLDMGPAHLELALNLEAMKLAMCYPMWAAMKVSLLGHCFCFPKCVSSVVERKNCLGEMEE